MAINVGDKTIGMRLNRDLSQAKAEEADALNQLSSGSRFTPEDPKPAERAIAESMEYKIRSLTASKRNINDAVSLLQTAQSGMTEISNIITRMKEINIAGATTTLSDQERRFLFVEYQALHDEGNRITQTTEFNGIPLLYGPSEKTPQELIFRVGDPFHVDGEKEDINIIKLEGLKKVDTTMEGLGLHSAKELLANSNDSEGITLEDTQDLLVAQNDDIFPTAYDQATTILSTHRAVYGALQTRLDKALDYVDVYQENIAAAKSKIADTDYVEETARLLKAKLNVHASTALLAQSNIEEQNAMQLIKSAF